MLNELADDIDKNESVGPEVQSAVKDIQADKTGSPLKVLGVL